MTTMFRGGWKNGGRWLFAAAALVLCGWAGDASAQCRMGGMPGMGSPGMRMGSPGMGGGMMGGGGMVGSRMMGGGGMVGSMGLLQQFQGAQALVQLHQMNAQMQMQQQMSRQYVAQQQYQMLQQSAASQAAARERSTPLTHRRPPLPGSKTALSGTKGKPAANTKVAKAGDDPSPVRSAKEKLLQRMRERQEELAVTKAARDVAAFEAKEAAGAN